ncbi:hypothetical protein ACFRFU_19565 [Streptomyces sp. NPDC056704]|uniref:hypothetical protein n=1 Tax=Streptomyces sp. NPDC056704 TaxID=3345917 RepID=UPI0036A69AD3
MSTATPTRITAPLPSAAVKAMASLEARLAGRTLSDQLAHEAGTHVRVTPDVQRAVDRFYALSDTIDRVSSRDSHYMTTSEVIDLHNMQEERARIYFQLTAAGMLHLVEVA